jgi:hypothetical protein
MAAGYLELYIEQGEDFSVNITLDSLNGEPYNLTNINIKSDIRKSYWSSNVAASFSANVANTQLGVLNLSLPANTSTIMRSGRYVYDVFITNTFDNTRSKVLEGMIHLDPSSTKP